MPLTLCHTVVSSHSANVSGVDVFVSSWHRIGGDKHFVGWTFSWGRLQVMHQDNNLHCSFWLSKHRCVAGMDKCDWYTTGDGCAFKCLYSAEKLRGEECQAGQKSI